jgi:hypothetical protein
LRLYLSILRLRPANVIPQGSSNQRQAAFAANLIRLHFPVRQKVLLPSGNVTAEWMTKLLQLHEFSTSHMYSRAQIQMMAGAVRLY